MIRAAHHANLTELAAAATVPVINGLTDLTHPCQVMADVMTLEEHDGPLKDQTVAWVGDGNNVDRLMDPCRGPPGRQAPHRLPQRTSAIALKCWPGPARWGPT